MINVMSKKRIAQFCAVALSLSLVFPAFGVADDGIELESIPEVVEVAVVVTAVEAEPVLVTVAVAAIEIMTDEAPTAVVEAAGTVAEGEPLEDPKAEPEPEVIVCDSCGADPCTCPVFPYDYTLIRSVRVEVERQFGTQAQFDAGTFTPGRIQTGNVSPTGMLANPVTGNVPNAQALAMGHTGWLDRAWNAEAGYHPAVTYSSTFVHAPQGNRQGIWTIVIRYVLIEETVVEPEPEICADCNEDPCDCAPESPPCEICDLHPCTCPPATQPCDTCNELDCKCDTESEPQDTTGGNGTGETGDTQGADTGDTGDVQGSGTTDTNDGATGDEATSGDTKTDDAAADGDKLAVAGAPVTGPATGDIVNIFGQMAAAAAITAALAGFALVRDRATTEKTRA
ncbi:MAG: hypothetical protein FWE46_04635 [Coriobacteriia bacterium]|nr:hypothetical protein [Coriobacteriia bacterium]